MAFQKEFMERAIEISRIKMNEGEGGPFGCLIVKDGKVIAEGWNRVTSTNDPTAHGEIVAIREACKALGSFLLRECDIYTSTEPCPMCLGAIYWARPAAIYYGNTRKDAANIGFADEFIYDELKLPLADRKLLIEQFMHDEAIKVFKEWELKSDRITY